MKIVLSKKFEYDNLFFCFAIVLSSVVGLFVQTVRLVVPNTFRLDTLFVYAVFAYVFFKALPSLRGKGIVTDYALLSFTILAFVFSLLRENSAADITFEVLKSIISECILLYLAAKMVRFTPTLLKYMRISAVITIANVILSVYVFAGGIGEAGYSQYDGYRLLTAMALLFLPMVNEHKLTDYLLAAFNLVAALLTGARGPFVLCALLLIFALIFVVKNKKYLALSIILVSGLVVVVIVNLENILGYIALNFGNSGSMRTIERILNSSLFEDAARGQIYEYAFEYIKEHLFIGCGVVNDRVIISSLMPSLGEIIGSYPHNIFIELMMQFGLIVGVFLSILLIFTTVKNYFRRESLSERAFLTSLIIAGLAPLMATGSYLEWPMFYVFLGFLLRKNTNLVERIRDDKRIAF